MTCKFLSLLFFCRVCISVFGQELQSPQINQNAIFANPGLAGSKGCTRISSNVGLFDFFNINSTHVYGSNALISVDGLAFKKSIGIAGYIKYNSYSNTSYSWETSEPVYKWNVNDSIRNTYYSTGNLRYSNIETGIIVAPKFYLQSNKTKENNRCISPSVSMGARRNNTIVRSVMQGDSLSIADQTYSTIELSHITIGLLYNTRKGYAGIKQSLIHMDGGGYSHKTAFVFGYTFCNKKVANPNFSFNPQLYLGFLYFRHNNFTQYEYPYHASWKNDLSINLDFRYKSIIWGLYNYHSHWISGSFGLTLGVQLKWARIVLNAAPAFLRKNGSEYYLSTSFTIKKKKSTYR